MLYIFAKKYGWTDWKEKLTGKIEVNYEEIAQTNSEIPSENN
jgi:hypothetical protein